MPMYDFRCDACGREFEELVSSDQTEVPCPKCKSVDTKKLLSAFATKSIGGGFAPPVPSGGGCAPGG